MHQKQIINMRQISFLTATLMTGGGLISVQNVLVRISRTDTWLTYTLPTVYVFVMIALFGYLAKIFPGKQIFEIVFELFGKWVGGILNVVLLIHIWLILIRDMSSFNRFFNTTLLPNTPLEILTLLGFSVLIYFGRTSLEVVARVNDIVFPLLVLIILLLPFALLNEIRIDYVQPVMTMPYWKFISSNVVATGWYGDIFVMGAFLHMNYNNKELKAGLRRGTIIATLLLSLSLLTETAVFGPFLPGNFIYPSYDLVQQIHITDFLDRVDIVMLMLWFPVASCKVCTIYIALLTGMGSFMRSGNRHILNKPAGVLLLIASLAAFRSMTEVFSFGNYSSPAIVLSYQPLYIVLLFAGAKLYLKRRRSSGLPPEAPVMQSGSGSGARAGAGTQSPFWSRLSARYPYAAWLKAGNAALIGLVVVTSAGFYFGKLCTWAGSTFALLYIAGMALLLFTTFAEMKTARES